MSSFVLPGLGRSLRRELEGADRLAILGAMIADRPVGRVLGQGRTLVRYSLDPGDGDRLMTAVRAMGQILFAAGAHEVLTGVPRAPRAHTLAELDALLAGTPRAICTCRPSTRPARPPRAAIRGGRRPMPGAVCGASKVSSSPTPPSCPAARR